MDAMKNAADFDDEEIIDLTDIIEKGAAPARKGGGLLEDQLSDLSSASSSDSQSSIDLDMDADIDALLAQMGGDPAGPSSETDASMPGMGQESSHSGDVNPDETLDMPGMSEVDSLLQELDMPPQPNSSQAAANALDNQDNAPPPPASATDLDALLNDMLDGGSNSQAAPEAGAALDNETEADFSTDFGAALSADLDDLDALLGNADAAPAAAAAPASAARASAAPAAPAPASPVPSGSPDISLDDLDALLGNADAAPAAAPAAAKPNQPEALNVADLDALLGQTNIPVAAGPAYVPDVGDLASLDALLGAATTPAHEPSPDTLDMLKNFDDTPIMSHTANNSVPTLAEDLMALDVMLNTDETAQDEPAAQTSIAEGHAATTHELMNSTPAANDGLLADLDALLSGATMDMSSNEATAQTASLDDETWRDPLPSFDDTAIQPEESPDDLLADIDPQELNRAAQELLDEKVMLEATTGDVDTSAWLSSLDEVLGEEENHDDVASASEAPLLGQDASASALSMADDITMSDATLPEGIVPSLHDELGEDGSTALADGLVPPMPLAAAAALGATAMAMAGNQRTSAASAAPASAHDAALTEEDRARISELEERLMALEELWQTREASHRQLLDHMGTQDLHHSERLSALEARLASVQSEAQAETNARLTQLEFRLDDVANQPTSASMSEEDEELRAARLDLMDGRIMVLEDAEEQRCAKEKAAAEQATEKQTADLTADAEAEDLPQNLLPNAAQDQSALSLLEERLSALENQTSQGQVELEERLTSLEGQFRHLESAMEERLRVLQGQFQQLESAMEEKLEQRAAAAAAKIIREEIAALLTEESK